MSGMTAVDTIKEKQRRFLNKAFLCPPLTLGEEAILELDEEIQKLKRSVVNIAILGAEEAMK